MLRTRRSKDPEPGAHPAPRETARAGWKAAVSPGASRPPRPAAWPLGTRAPSLVTTPVPQVRRRGPRDPVGRNRAARRLNACHSRLARHRRRHHHRDRGPAEDAPRRTAVDNTTPEPKNTAMKKPSLLSLATIAICPATLRRRLPNATNARMADPPGSTEKRQGARSSSPTTRFSASGCARATYRETTGSSTSTGSNAKRRNSNWFG